MNISFLRDFILCTAATAFFAILFQVPRRAIILSALLGGAGYLLYDITTPLTHSAIAGYFFGTLFMAICSEILARIKRIPATIFMIPAIVPLVPGLGLYNTMMYLVQKKNSLAAKTGTSTILEIIAMAMAMVLTAILTSMFISIIRNLKSRLNSRHV